MSGICFLGHYFHSLASVKSKTVPGFVLGSVDPQVDRRHHDSPTVPVTLSTLVWLPSVQHGLEVLVLFLHLVSEGGAWPSF